jgi:hypothetical protein
MRRLRNAALGSLLTLALFAPFGAAQGQDQAAAPTPEAEREAKRTAPVLCVWELYLATKIVAEACHAGEDPALQSELGRSIERVDAFIIKNAPATQAQVDSFKQQFHDQSVGQDLCKNPGAQAMYADAKRAGAERIRADTDDLILMPRTPTKNGC